MSSVSTPASLRSPSDPTITARARRLAYVTIGWTAFEAIVGMWTAGVAGSVALLAFGVDSLIEVASSAVVLWRFSGSHGMRRERRAGLMVGSSLLLLAAFVAVDSVTALVENREPRITAVGIALTAAAVLVMPVLARLKRRVAGQVQSQALAGDARQSDICAWLSAVTLAGLGLRAGLGWWWADPAAALVLVPLIGREGIALLRGENSCAGCSAGPLRRLDSVDDV